MNCLNENGYIFFHDFVPRNFLEEYNPRIVNLWTGDVWKVSIELSQSLKEQLEEIQNESSFVDDSLREAKLNTVNLLQELEVLNEELNNVRGEYAISLSKPIELDDNEKDLEEIPSPKIFPV